MPKERIRKADGDGFADLLVQWGPEELGPEEKSDRRRVRLFVIAAELGQPGGFYFHPNLTEEEKLADPNRIGAHGEGIGPIDVMLDREGCNRMIQMLRRARDKTFGRDE